MYHHVSPHSLHQKPGPKDSPAAIRPVKDVFNLQHRPVAGPDVCWCVSAMNIYSLCSSTVFWLVRLTSYGMTWKYYGISWITMDKLWNIFTMECYGYILP